MRGCGPLGPGSSPGPGLGGTMLWLLFLGMVFSTAYYVYQDGSVELHLNTSFPLINFTTLKGTYYVNETHLIPNGSLIILTQDLTSKSGNIWKLSVPSPGLVVFLFNAKILNLPNNSTITSDQDRIIISISSPSKITYQIPPNNNNSGLLIILVAITVPILYFTYTHVFLKKPSSKFNHLPTTERLILEHIEKNPGITQKALSQALGIPKSTLSYHLNKLEQRGLIRRESKGLSNKLYINKL